MVKPDRKYPIILVVLTYVSFISLGLPDGLNGVAWPSIRVYFNLPLDALGSLLVFFTAGYLVSSFSCGRLLMLMNLGSVLALSCFATAVSLVGYALAPAWWLMVSLGTIAGLGAGAIDAGLNTFAATQFSARMVNWLHACYGVGAASGAIVISSVLAMHRSWQWGYAVVGLWQLLLAICFAFTKRYWARKTAGEQNDPISGRVSNVSTLRLPVMWLSITVFFLYTGIEAAAGVWAYTLFTESRGIPVMMAGLWVSLYWAALTVGRLIAGFAVGSVPAVRLLRFSAVVLALGAAMICVTGIRELSFLGLTLMGFAAAPIFPSLIATTPARLGSTHTTNAVGFQIAAAVLGQSLVPAFIGVLAGRLGLEIAGLSLFIVSVMLFILVQTLTSARISRLQLAVADNPVTHLPR